jgi:hypothetical protein
VLAVVAGLGLAIDEDLVGRLRSVLGQRSRGPAELWGEVVDSVNRRERDA